MEYLQRRNSQTIQSKVLIAKNQGEEAKNDQDKRSREEIKGKT